MEPTFYKIGNSWQQDRYDFMSQLNIKSGIKDFGKSKEKGKPYYHILSGKEDKFKLHNFLYEDEIYREVNERFKTKAGDLTRVLTNTVASQPCCFNLFVPLKNRLPLASRLFSILLNKEVSVYNIEIEFTPQKTIDYDETIGDQLEIGGTDADVAIFYTYENDKEGVLLLEFKYIEAEFSVCSSYKNKNGKLKDGVKKKDIRGACNSADYYDILISPNINSTVKHFDCGYLKYQNWKLLQNSTAFDLDKIRSSPGCPFRYSANQLWRNMLLAEKVAEARKLQEFGFWVLFPEQNSFLWGSPVMQVRNSFENLLTEKGKNAFKVLDIDKDFVSVLERVCVEDGPKEWIEKFRTRYLTGFNK